jgi:hypothetical protein
MSEEKNNLEQEDSSHDKKPMCQMCQMCPYLQQNPNMMGMYQQQMQQPNPNVRDEYEDEDYLDEDDFRRRRRRKRYIWNPFLWMWVLS